MLAEVENFLGTLTKKEPFNLFLPSSDNPNLAIFKSVVWPSVWKFIPPLFNPVPEVILPSSSNLSDKVNLNAFLCFLPLLSAAVPVVPIS